jgi:hypothetical protein
MTFMFTQHQEVVVTYWGSIDVRCRGGCVDKIQAECYRSRNFTFVA